MPTLSVERDTLFTCLGKSYTDDEFEDLCFEFGVELDEITSEREEALKSQTVSLSKEAISSLSSSVIYKIDVPANRYDLLCVEGLSRALKIFLGEMDSPTYAVIMSDAMEKMTVHSTETNQIRPHVVCAILRDVEFTPERYKSFIDLQDQLHKNLCRNRSLVAIGTHDLDSVQGPFSYRALPPEEIKFVPLTHETEFSAKDLMETYLTDPACKHLKPYVPLIHSSPVYPVITDANGIVLSLPPIINGSHSKIALNTKNVLVECTATDLTKANIVLDTMVAMFSEYCSEPFSVEPVFISYVNDGTEFNNYITPLMYTRTERAGCSFINSLIGIDLDPEHMLTLCQKIQLAPATLIEENDDLILEVTVPPTRSDILHACDVAEDIAIAFGYNNIQKRIPYTSTVGGEQPLNKLSDALRDEIAMAGYTEVLTHGLCSLEDNFTNLQRPKTEAVSLLNPANIEYQIVRTSLLPGLLKTVQHNKKAKFSKGFSIFEIGEVVLPDSSYERCQTIIGARNVRRICAVYAGPTSGFEIIHGLVDRIFMLCEVSPSAECLANSAKGDEEKFRVVREGWEYRICEQKEAVDKVYFPGRSANIYLRASGKEEILLGSFGILHPNVLKNFDIGWPASCVEMDLGPLL